MRALVTGGAGFIGSNLVDRLAELGHEVRVLDNFSTGHRRNLADLRGEVEIIEGELRSYERVHNAVAGCEVVFHQGALPSVPRSIQDPITTSDVNVGGTLNVLLAARDAGVRRVICASSSSIYGDAPGLPRREDMAPLPMSPYAVSKLAGEAYCRSATEVYGLETIALRYFNVFGKRQDPDSQYSAVIPRFIKAMLAGKPPTVFGDGDQSRDFTHVENVVAANLLAADAPKADGSAINVASGSRYSLNELVTKLNELLGSNLQAEHRAERLGDVRHSWADISMARELIGFEPSVGFEQGLALTVADFEGATPESAVR